MQVNGKRVPDIIVGGAPRSGTTLSCEILARHPDIFVLRPFIPEPKVCLLDLGPVDAAYLDHYAGLFASAPADACCIEKTSNYWENDHARERLSRMLPETRFIFILREPIARAYSNWRWSTQNGLETLSFEEAFDRSDRRSPLPSRQRHARPFDYLPRSEYGRLASEWIAAVGLHRLRFYLFEQVTAGLDAWSNDLFAYAGVRNLPNGADIGVINAAVDQSHIDRTLEHQLRARIRPEVHRFAELTGTDVSCWGY